MRNIKRNVAVIGAGAVIAGFGIGGVMTAQAATSTQGSDTSVVQTDTRKGEGPEGTEAAESDDGPDVGPDANPNEPGHQDADESGEAESSEGTEAAESGEADDGPDANPNEPGHQDADESGESAK